jgi:hypothetical protein
MVTISSIDPSDAQEATRWRPENDARVDLEGDVAAPSAYTRRMTVEIESAAFCWRLPATSPCPASPMS